MTMFKIVAVLSLWCAIAQAETTCRPDGTEWDCTNLNLTSIPKDIPDSATLIDMSDNLMTEFKADEIGHLPNLTTLILDNNQITALPELCLDSNKMLVNFSVAQNNLTEIPDKLFVNTPMTYLNLAQNLFKKIPDNTFANLTGLEYLDLTSLNKEGDLENVTKMLILGENFKFLTGLKTLLIGGLGFTNISKELFQHVNNGLTMLDLSFNKLETPGDGAFVGHKKLEALNFENNHISSITDDAFKGLANLHTLNVGYNELKTISDKLCTEIPKLQSLNLNGFKGSTLSKDAFSKCTSIQGIAMTFSSIKDIGTAFSNLPHLNTTDLSNNPLLQITNENAFANSSALEILDLHGMATSKGGNFYELPVAIRKVPHLKELDISYSRFSAFSKQDTVFFDNLTNLYASNNPYDCACRHIDFVMWFKNTTKSPVPAEERNDYNCSTCDQCDSLPTPLGNFSLSHCNSSPTDNHRKIVKYGIGLAFAGLIFGVLCTSCVAYILFKKKAICFKPGGGYEDLDRSTNA